MFAAAATFAATSEATYAQVADGGLAAPAPAAAPQHYDNAILRSFALAATQVLALRNGYMPRVRAAELAGGPERASALFAEMRKRMQAAITSAGFTDEQYSALSEAVQTDLMLRRRVNAILNGDERRFARQRGAAGAPPARQGSAEPRDAPAAAPADAPADAPSRERLTAELDKANAKHERYESERSQLREKIRELESKLSTVRSSDSRLREQLNAERAKALAAQQRNQANLAGLDEQVANLRAELAAARSRDTSLREELDAERSRALAQQARDQAKLIALRREIKRLAGELAVAQRSLAKLDAELAGGGGQTEAAGPSAPPGPAGGGIRPLEPMTPVHRGAPESLERALSKAEPHYELRRQLDAERARLRVERRRRLAERAALQQKIEGLAEALATTYESLGGLAGIPAGNAAQAGDGRADDDAVSFQFEFAALPDAPLALASANDAAEPAAPVGEPPKADDDAAADAADTQAAETSAPVANAVATAPPVAAPPRGTAPDFAAEDASGPLDAGAHTREAEAASTAAAAPPQRTAPVGNHVAGGIAAYMEGDYASAFEIWAPLARAGNARAQFHLGALYFEGRGTSADFGRAYFWLRLAAYQGQERATPLLARVADRLTADEIRESEGRAREWLLNNPVKFTDNRRERRSRL